MSIKRITNPKEFYQVIDDLADLFNYEDGEQGHQLLRHDKECIKLNFGHAAILNWDLLVWANLNNGKFDAMIAFVNEKNPKFNAWVFSEFLWLSKNPEVGYKLFSTATKFAKAKGFEYLLMNTVARHPAHEKLKSFYSKIGMLKDSETYICKL